MFTDEECAYVNFVYGVCNGSGRLFWHINDSIYFLEFHIAQYLRTVTTLSDASSLPRANTEHELQVCETDGVVAAVQ
jgi:hypothetical protein